LQRAFRYVMILERDRIIMTKNMSSKDKSIQPEAAILRQKAERLLKTRQVKANWQLSEAETLKLIHELQVYQIELEIQNQELLHAKYAEKSAAELYDFAPSGYFKLSREGVILGINLYGAKMLDKGQQALVNSRFGFFISNDTKPVFNNFLENIFNIKNKQTCEVTLSANNDLAIYLHLTGILSENGEWANISASDITGYKQTEEIIKLKNDQLFLKDVQKDLFISILAHDLKSPYSSILGFLSLLTENIRNYDIDTIEEQLAVINKSAQNSFKLLEDILTWANSQAGRITYKPQPIILSSVCRDIMYNMQTLAYTKNIMVNVSVPDDIYVFADIDMLKSILRNLVSNAIKFTNPGGEVGINAEQGPHKVQITVSDSGTGIAPNKLSDLFTISKIYTSKGTANESGTGLGLLICKEFVEKHDGKIWAESELGKGSNFKFYLPVRDNK
jgi:signal transduction histidine kinase